MENGLSDLNVLLTKKNGIRKIILIDLLIHVLFL